jgi:putative Mg2+ transporter-C (MgtC) family protein
MAAGAGLPILAVAVTLGHFVLVFIFPAIERRLPKSRWVPSSLHISYEVSRVQVERAPTQGRGRSGGQAGKGRGAGREDHPVETEEAPLADLPHHGIVTLVIEVRGAKSVAKLAARLSEIGGVTSVRIGEDESSLD